MDESSSSPLDGDRTAERLPFSQRQHVQAASSDISSQTTPDDKSPALAAEVELVTLPTVTQPTQAIVSSSAFQLLKPEEITSDERRQIEIQMTAHYWAHKLLDKEGYIDPPMPYHERAFIWKMIFQQTIPSAVIVLILALLPMSFIGGWSSWTLSLILVVSMLAAGVAMLRIYILWRTTYLIVTEKTGFQYKKIRWLLMMRDDQTTYTATIGTVRINQGKFAGFFNLNAWQLDMDTPVQDDAFLCNLRFVRDAKRLERTISDYKRYAAQSRR